MTDPRLEAKRRAAARAAALVESGMVVGLGTGSTAALAIEAIATRLDNGSLDDIVGVPTSARTREHARRLGIPLTTLDDVSDVDLTIDGADQIDQDGNMIKGGGGALLWEKIVAAQTRRYVIVVDESKLVERLGTGFPLPVEVVPFGWRTHIPVVRELGGDASLRTGPSGEPYQTDAGHYILDCEFADGIADPTGVELALQARPGIVETGLFLDMHPTVIVGRADHA